jgi:5-methylcytosine-specific restriction endonuclease McrA
METQTIKPCVKCGATDRNKGGDCRLCNRAYNSKWRAEHAEHIKVSWAKWYAAHADKEKARRATEDRKIAVAKWTKANPDKVRASKTKYRNKNTERLRVYNADRYSKHHESMKAIGAKWAADHPENFRLASHRRRARKLAAGGSFSVAEIKAMLKSQKGKCVVCRTNISKDYHIDHVMPLSLGGSNGITNIQLLCPHCNLTKQARHPVDFMQQKGFLL